MVCYLKNRKPVYRDVIIHNTAVLSGIGILPISSCVAIRTHLPVYVMCYAFSYRVRAAAAADRTVSISIVDKRVTTLSTVLISSLS